MYDIIACWGHSDVKIYNIKQDRYIIYHQFTIWYRMPLSVHSIQYTKENFIHYKYWWARPTIFLSNILYFIKYEFIHFC